MSEPNLAAEAAALRVIPRERAQRFHVLQLITREPTSFAWVSQHRSKATALEAIARELDGDRCDCGIFDLQASRFVADSTEHIK
jgi:hypothetical protein